MKKLLSFLLAFVIVLGLLPTTQVSASAAPLTRRELMEMLISASDDYNKSAPSEIIRGDDEGQLRYDDKATRLEALVMLRRAFGKLPPLSGNRLYERIADTVVSFSDIPEWAKEDIDALIAAGVMANTKDGNLNGEEYITEPEIKNLLHRVWMLYGSNEKDDFFTAHERKTINNSEQYAGYIGVGSVYEIFDRQNKRIDAILDEILAGQWTKGSDQQKIKDFYEAALAVTSGKSSGLGPIKAYLKAVDSAHSLSSLMDVNCQIYAETGRTLAFLTPYIESDSVDSSKNVLWISPDISPFDANTYSGEAVTKAAAEYFEKVLIIGGESESAAKKAANDILNYEKALAAVQTAPENLYNVEYFYNVMSTADADALLENIDLRALLTKLGYTVPESLVIDDLGAFKYLCGYLKDENLEALKNIAKYSILSKFGSYLSSDYYEASLDLSKVVYGDIKPQSAKEQARSLLTKELDTEIGKMYVSKHFTQADKFRLLEIEKVLMEIFRERIKALDWMSEETKQKAIKKLDAMTFKNIWPDYWFTDKESKYVPSFEILPLTEGGSLYKNYTAISRARKNMNVAKEGTPVDKAKWDSSPLTVNAAYYFSENCVYILAGAMDTPFYDDSSIEAILGSMGGLIGHEITHAFDDSGAKFDENGNRAEWWTAEDYAAFKERCLKMENLFDRFEAAPGIMASGKITVGENVADLGGFTLSVEAAKRLIKNPDYKVFFESHSHAWCQSFTRPTVNYLTSFEAHSMAYLRVNVPLMQLNEFYKTYGITEGDGMYLPPEDRVSIW